MTDHPPHPDAITITMTRSQAEEVAYGLADLLCWHRGFAAARESMGAEHDTAPMGIFETRRMAEIVKGALK